LDPEKRRAALDLAARGDEAWSRGDFADALGKFTGARALVPAPTLAVRQGECLEKLGRLIEAAAVFGEAARFPLTGNVSEPFRQAVTLAGAHLEGLKIRIPTLAIEVISPGDPEPRVALDGKALPKEQWSQAIPLDPGIHQVTASGGAGEIADRVRLSEGERARIVLRPTPPPPHPPTELSTKVATDHAPPTLRPWAWVGFGVGAAGTLAGLGTGIAVLKWRNDLDDGGCVATVCPTRQQGEVGTYNTLRTASVVGFVAGGVGFATGAILWFLDSGKPGSRKGGLTLAPTLGPGSAGVIGTF
jgi:hypothetical protein